MSYRAGTITLVLSRLRQRKSSGRCSRLATSCTVIILCIGTSSRKICSCQGMGFLRYAISALHASSLLRIFRNRSHWLSTSAPDGTELPSCSSGRLPIPMLWMSGPLAASLSSLSLVLPFSLEILILKCSNWSSRCFLGVKSYRRTSARPLLETTYSRMFSCQRRKRTMKRPNLT